MKAGQLTLIFVVVIFSVSCSKQNTGVYDKKEAFENFTVCKQIADEWLNALDSTDYSQLISVRQLNGGNITEISSYINEARKAYGK